MALFIRGMEGDERVALTVAMRDSGSLSPRVAIRCRKPSKRAPPGSASTGPVMVASWVVDAEAATARGNNGGETTAGSKVCCVGASNARPTPNTRTATRMNSLLIHP